MANTITADLHSQVMTCRICGETAEIPRKLLRDQHGLMEATDDFAADHRECKQYEAQPDMARLARRFRKGLKRELTTRLRCTAASRGVITRKYIGTAWAAAPSRMFP